MQCIAIVINVLVNKISKFRPTTCFNLKIAPFVHAWRPHLASFRHKEEVRPWDQDPFSPSLLFGIRCPTSIPMSKITILQILYLQESLDRLCKMFRKCRPIFPLPGVNIAPSSVCPSLRWTLWPELLLGTHKDKNVFYVHSLVGG